jgi:uncharacterized membrane protein
LAILTLSTGCYTSLSRASANGIRGRIKEESEGITGGMLASYVGVVGEGVEMTTLTTAIGAEAGNAFFSDWIGEAIGIAVVLALLGLIRPLLKRIPQWAFQLTVGFIMMGISALLMFLGEKR